ncbi:MAG: DegT/DnrJ/EryC1/StrS family aminotransferase [bacterium]|nr:DegT/DnrJ/EryC1/StrS family aminotransferase [bacterium]
MKFKYPVYQPFLNGNEKQYVLECLDSTWISSKGKFINEFEKKFADYLGIEFAASVSNGTVALHVALIALGIGPGDEVIVPTFTYIASVNSITYTGATPVFVESDTSTWQMDIADTRKKITSKTKAILAVHLYGHPCEIDELRKIADDNNLFLIEDTAEALGSKYEGKKVGTFGDVSTFSFFGNKTVTTGEGGMVVTNSKDLHEKCVHIKGQGLAKDAEYWHDIIGYNYRMTNICAAIGLAQLERVNDIIESKRDIAKWYKDYLKDLPVLFHDELDKRYFSTYWMISILVKDSATRQNLRKHLAEKGIETRPAFHPVHTMPMYVKPDYQFPVAENLGARGINLPSYPQLTKEDVKFISNTIRKFYERD